MTKEGLTKKISLDPFGGEIVNSYQYRSCAGDIVILPNGELGIITNEDIYFGCAKVVHVYPLEAGRLRRLIRRIRNSHEFWDDKINSLVKLHSLGESFWDNKSRSWFKIGKIEVIKNIAERELNRIIGLIVEEDWQELEALRS